MENRFDTGKSNLFTNWGKELLWIILAGLFIFPVLQFGLSNDEGLFAVQGTRVLAGELPVTDFATAYLGGNSYLFALYFKLFGTSFWALRLGFLMVTMLLGGTIYHLSKQLLGDTIWAHLSTLIALSLSITIYPFISAGWHALLFSLLAFSCFLHALNTNTETDSGSKKQSLLFVTAGVFAGLCLLMKQTIALYTGFPFLISLVLYHASKPSLSQQAKQKTNPVLSTLLIGLLTIPFLYLLFIFKTHFTLANQIHFILPSTIFITLALMQTLKTPSIAQPLLKDFGLITAGGLSILLVYLLPYIFNGQLSLWMQESFSNPNTYLHLYFLPFESQALGNIIIAFFVLAVVVSARQWLSGLIFTFLFFFLTYHLGFTDYISATRGTMSELTQTFFTLIFISTGLIFKNYPQGLLPKKYTPILYTLIYGTMMLVNLYPAYLFPYFGTSVIPLVIVLIFGVKHFWQQPDIKALAKGLLLCPIIYFAVFGYLHMMRVVDFTKDRLNWQPFQQFSNTLENPRFGLKVQEQAHQSLTQLLTFISTTPHQPTDFYFLGNEGAEYYFLTHLNNPTPYDFHQHSLATDGSSIMSALETYTTQYLVIPLMHQSTQPANNFAIQKKLQDYINTHYDQHAVINHYKIMQRRTNSKSTSPS